MEGGSSEVNSFLGEWDGKGKRPGTPASPAKKPKPGPAGVALLKLMPGMGADALTPRTEHAIELAEHEREDSVMRIEHVVQHLEELATMEEDAEDTFDAAHQARERKKLHRALKTISDEMTGDYIFADDSAHHVIESNHDNLPELTEHLLKFIREEHPEIMTAEQFNEATETLHHSTNSNHSNSNHSTNLGAAMANGLAIVTLFESSVKSRIYAFARLKENVHVVDFHGVGEVDKKGVQFLFVIIEPLDANDAGVHKEDIARAMSLILNQDTLRDQLLTCPADNSAQSIQQFFTTNGSNMFSKLMKDVENWERGERAAIMDWEKIEALDDMAKQAKLKHHKIEMLKAGKLLAAARESPNAIGLKWVPEEWPFGGIKRDLKRRILSPVYFQDWKDGMTTQTIAVTLFMFFACIAPAIAFGSMLARSTCKRNDPMCVGPLVVVGRQDTYKGTLCPCTAQIGVIEMLLSTAVCGIGYSLFGGSPLTVLGGTGPVAVFTGVLYSLSETLEIDFFPFYAWVGIWIGVFSTILAITDAACIISVVTRFTDEIFAGLISTIFTISATTDLYLIWTDGKEELCSANPNSTASVKAFSRQKLEDIVDDKATLNDLPCMPLLQLEAKTIVSVVLALGTFWVAMQLKQMRESQLTHRNVRKFLGDFGVAIAIFTMVLVHEFVFTTPVDMLVLPEKFETTSGRDWWVGLGGLSIGWIFFAMVPALLGLTLVWLDDNITYRLINSTDNKVVKGTAYHYNTLILGIFIGVSSLFGLPWLVAATVRSMLMVKSLAVTEKDGAGRERIVSVNDNRLCSFLIHSLILLAVFIPDVLKKIPQSVITGLFLFMGISSMKGNTMFERVELMGIWEAANYPSDSYIKKVSSMAVIHKFTFIQVTCLVILYVVKSSPIGISFPIFIGMLPFVRYFTGKLIGETDCELLDPEELD